MKHPEKSKSPLNTDWQRQAAEIDQALRQRAKEEQRRMTRAPIAESVRRIGQLWESTPPKPPAQAAKKR